MTEWNEGCREHAVLGVHVVSRWLAVERIVEQSIADDSGDEALAERQCQLEAVHICQCCGGPALVPNDYGVCSRCSLGDDHDRTDQNARPAGR